MSLTLLAERAQLRDEEASFPTEEIDALRAEGVLAQPLPVEHPDEPGLADRLAALLMDLGAGSLAVGRIIEAHVNARHLIARFGTEAQRAQAADDVRNGHLFALWVTDPPQGGLSMAPTPHGFRLTGGKMFCSAAGHATRTLVTAVDPAGTTRMLVVALGHGEQVRPLGSPLQGMRAAVTGAVDFTGCVVPQEACLGEPGDYLREPDFSCGAWRSSAVAAGGLRSLLDQLQQQLHAGGRLDNPHQLQRVGTVMIAEETARLWVHRVAQVAENPCCDPADAVAYTGLARIAVESACLAAMPLVQRSLGLGAFRRSNPVERICRDLATYLRQPAPDDVLTEAAMHLARRAIA